DQHGRLQRQIARIDRLDRNSRAFVRDRNPGLRLALPQQVLLQLVGGHVLELGHIAFLAECDRAAWSGWPAPCRLLLADHIRPTFMATIETTGGYACIPGVFQYSAGVAALPGFRIERVRFSRLVPLGEGFAVAARLIEAAGRPLTAFCACELRSPAPFTEAGFRTFNEGYVRTLAAWGVVTDGANPVARSNVCPEVDAPAE